MNTFLRGIRGSAIEPLMDSVTISSQIMCVFPLSNTWVELISVTSRLLLVFFSKRSTTSRLISSFLPSMYFCALVHFLWLHVQTHPRPTCLLSFNSLCGKKKKKEPLLIYSFNMKTFTIHDSGITIHQASVYVMLYESLSLKWATKNHAPSFHYQPRPLSSSSSSSSFSFFFFLLNILVTFPSPYADVPTFNEECAYVWW